MNLNTNKDGLVIEKIDTERKYAEVLQKAIDNNCEKEFIEILRRKPLYPILFVDENHESFGKKVKCLDESTTGLKSNELGYILGVWRPNNEGGRQEGSIEAVFPAFDYKGNYYTLCYSLKFEQFDFL